MVHARLSFSGKVWRPRAEALERHHQCARSLDLGELFAPLLASRGLEETAAAEAFLNPRLRQLADPLTLSDMEAAVARLVHALEHQESLAVFGDYDVDGLTSSALLRRYFRALGVDSRIYIPDRLDEGYGPNSAAMERLRGEGVDLLITVDCGVTAFDALATARKVGLDVIVTDHHQGREELPPACAVVNPNRLDDLFPHKELAGVGVAFYLVLALNRALREKGWFTPSRPEPDLKQLLDLVAVGTIADVSRLVGLNRPLVNAGLQQAAHTTNVGLRALMTRCGIATTPTAGQVGFHMAPRLNAGGRLQRASLGHELLVTEDPERAREIADLLEQSNLERQALEHTMLTAALAQIQERKLHETSMGMVVAGEGWHPGVVGIVASRLADRYHRPTIVVAWDDTGKGRGSARSIPGLDLLRAIESVGEHLVGFGGHKAAAGITIRQENFAAFAEAFDQAVREQNQAEVFQPALLVDGALALEQAGRDLLSRLDRLQPFGMGNPEPVFVLEGVRVAHHQVMKERHIKLWLDNEARYPSLQAVLFQALPGALGQELLNLEGRRVDVAGTLFLNRFRDRETVQLVVKDARLAE